MSVPVVLRPYRQTPQSSIPQKIGPRPGRTHISKQKEGEEVYESVRQSFVLPQGFRDLKLISIRLMDVLEVRERPVSTRWSSNAGLWEEEVLVAVVGK
jgi:hypothetical protein